MVASHLDATSWATDMPVPAIAAGLVVLILGANALVRGAVWIALALGMSRMTVGLTLVAFGTSLPEFLVSLTSATKGNNDIAIANVLGSNTMNVLLIIGVAAAIRAIRLAVDVLELAFMLLATALAALPFVLGTDVGRPLAGGMVAMLIAFCWLLLHRERRRSVIAAVAADQTEERPRSTGLQVGGHVALIVGGLAMLKFGADWLVDGSVAIARSSGMSDALIGMTIVAGGTSLPELATSALAARKGHPEIAIGNVVGSNIFNVGCVLGLCGLIQPIGVNRDALLPLLVATAASAVWLAALLRLRNGVGRISALAFMTSYGAYIAWEAHRCGAI